MRPIRPHQRCQSLRNTQSDNFPLSWISSALAPHRPRDTQAEAASCPFPDPPPRQRGNRAGYLTSCPAYVEQRRAGDILVMDAGAFVLVAVCAEMRCCDQGRSLEGRSVRHWRNGDGWRSMHRRRWLSRTRRHLSLSLDSLLNVQLRFFVSCEIFGIVQHQVFPAVDVAHAQHVHSIACTNSIIH